MTDTLAVHGLAGLRTTVEQSRPDWLSRAREAAFDWIADRGFPTRKDEDWRYLRLGPIVGPIVEGALSPARREDGHGVTSSMLAGLVPDLGGARLVFVNGLLAHDLSSGSGSGSGANITGVMSMLLDDPDRVAARFGVGASEQVHLDGFAALNVALAEDGAYIDVPADLTLEQPIHLVFCTTSHTGTVGGDPVMSSPRSMVHAGPNSRVTIIETHVGIGDAPTCTNAVTKVTLDAGAHVHHVVVQDMPLAAFHLDVLDVVQAADSTFSSRAFSLGGAIARHEARVLLDGEHAEVALAGLYLPAGAQHHDHPVMVEHRAPNCTSSQQYHGVLDERGHGVFNGRIVVQPTGGGTDATQSNKNLILSDQAEIDTRPRLEILAHDVRCAHGATVGQLDREAIHYLRTRGINEATARGMLTSAFANEMVEQVTLAPLRDWIQRLVSERLHHVSDPTSTELS